MQKLDTDTTASSNLSVPSSSKAEIALPDKVDIGVHVEPFPIVRPKFIRGDLDEGSEGN